MSQDEIDRAVAKVTGENLGIIKSRGFSIADILDVNIEPESRGPLLLDWDAMLPAEWPL